jgi:hypothetical protein
LAWEEAEERAASPADLALAVIWAAATPCFESWEEREALATAEADSADLLATLRAEERDEAAWAE